MPAPDGAEIVDTVLPGLIDGHVHLAFDASADPVATLDTRDDAAAFAAMNVTGGYLVTDRMLEMFKARPRGVQRAGGRAGAR